MTTTAPAARSIRPIMDSILDAIGNTPMVRLDRIARQEGLKCNLLGKVEFFNAGGSVKDRIAKRMVEKAEEEGKLIPGQSVVIEPSSGNTGIGLSLACALKGYPVIITLPEKMSLEKEVTLRALGAEVVRTPTEAPSLSEESNIGVANRLQKLIPGGVILDQYSNINNPLAHVFGTGEEIIAQVAQAGTGVEVGGRKSTGKVDVLVAGAGTGGTISGCSQVLKKYNPEVAVVGVDPIGSILARPESRNIVKAGESSTYLVEGIGYDFVPDTLDHSAVDEWVKISDDDAWSTTRQAMRYEGLLVGGSSGAILAGALQWLKSEEGFKKYGGVEGVNVVVILPDGIRNYMSKPWFRDALDAAGPTPLAAKIAKALGKPVASGAETVYTNGDASVTARIPTEDH